MNKIKPPTVAKLPPFLGRIVVKLQHSFMQLRLAFLMATIASGPMEEDPHFASAIFSISRSMNKFYFGRGIEWPNYQHEYIV